MAPPAEPIRVAVVLAQRLTDGAVLIDRRASNNPQAPNKWEFPGGKYDAHAGDTTVRDTAVRELRAETGLLTTTADLRVLEHFNQRGTHVAADITFFLTRRFTGEAQAYNEVAEVRWVPLTELPQVPDFLPNERGQTKRLLDYLIDWEAQALQSAASA